MAPPRSPYNRRRGESARERTAMTAITQLNLDDAVPISASAEMRPLRVGVLVDLALTAEAGGHLKCWQRLAEEAVGLGDRLAPTEPFRRSKPPRNDLFPSAS